MTDALGSQRGTTGQGWNIKVRGKSLVRGLLAVAAALSVMGVFPALGSAAELLGDFPGYYKTRGELAPGGASGADAPLLKPGGIFTDRIRPGETKFYKVKLDSTSSVYLSAFALPEAGAEVALNDGLRLSLQTVSGADCGGRGDFNFRSTGAARPVGGFTSRRSGAGTQCQQSGDYLFSVERKSEPKSDHAAWPMEIRYMVEPGLKKGAEPKPLASAGSAPPALPTGKAKEAQGGGTGFNDARTVHSGVWKAQLSPGQTIFYQVPVGWGQQLSALAEFANTVAPTDEDADQSEGVRLELFNPARGIVANKTAFYSGRRAVTQINTPRADYTNRDTAPDDLGRGMCFAGWYYLALSLHPAVRTFVDGKVDVTLRVQVKGERQQRPDYDGDEVKAGFGLSEDDYRAGGPSEPSAAGDGKTLLAFGAFGTGGALLLSLVVWLLVTRCRPGEAVPTGRPGAPAGHSGPGGPGGPGGHSGPGGPGPPGGQPPVRW